MKEQNTLSAGELSKLEKEEAYRLGYSAGVSGLVGNRDLCPLVSPSLRALWKKGFDLATTKGLKVKLPGFGAGR